MKTNTVPLTRIAYNFIDLFNIKAFHTFKIPINAQEGITA